MVKTREVKVQVAKWLLCSMCISASEGLEESLETHSRAMPGDQDRIAGVVRS